MRCDYRRISGTASGAVRRSASPRYTDESVRNDDRHPESPSNLCRRPGNPGHGRHRRRGRRRSPPSAPTGPWRGSSCWAGACICSRSTSFTASCSTRRPRSVSSSSTCSTGSTTGITTRCATGTCSSRRSGSRFPSRRSRSPHCASSCRSVDALIAILGGSVCAYLVFEWLHLTSHVRMSKGRLTRYITRRHARHHYIDHHHWFTVSPGGQLVDKALGSAPAHCAVVPNVHTCGLDADDPRLVRSRLRFGSDTSLVLTASAPAVAWRSRSRGMKPRRRPACGELSCWS